MESTRRPWHQHAVATDPDLSFCGLSLWIHRREFPDSTDYWDSNWLVSRVLMQMNGARVECSGPFLTTTDIERFRDQLVAMMDNMAGTATLTPLEPELNIAFTMDKRGHLEAVIEVTPDHLTQRHRFTIETDQTFLPELLASCDAILLRFPVINAGN